MSAKNEIIVFDANFFICMNSIRAKNFLGNLEKAGSDLGFKYYISAVVFEEIKAPTTFRDKFQKIINVEKIGSVEIESIKNDLSKQGIRFPAQDPDLSLLSLSRKLFDKDNNLSINLVSDDFKLVKNANLFFRGKINILSLSSFLLKIHRTISNKQLRGYFKNIWKRSLNYTLSYMIERSKIYPAEEKITWLIEKAIMVTQDSILTQDAHYIDSQKGPVRFEIGASKFEKEITICEKFIENHSLSNSEEELVSGIVNFLENLKISREYVKQARKAIEKHDSKNAVKYLKKGNGFLISLLQIASGQLTTLKDYEIVEKLICSEISKMEFLRAFILISLGRVDNAIDSLERAALFATIIHNHQTCLTLNYVKALILLFHGLYNNAIIMAIMDEISNMDMEKNFLDAIIVFSELGDYFLALGHSQLAANLYNEALEISIDYKLKIRSDILIEKLKRAYIATVLNGYSTEDIMVDRLDVLLNKAYSLKDVEKYNEQIKKISMFNVLFYTPFPYITGKKKIIPYIKLPKELQEDYLEVVHFEKLKSKGVSKYLFIVSHYELGLLGIILKTDETVIGIAENYTLKLKPTSKVKIYNPSEVLRDTYLIRAIIEVVAKNECKIIYSLPSFFKSLNI